MYFVDRWFMLRFWFFFLITRRLPRSTLFPYTTLFRSRARPRHVADVSRSPAREGPARRGRGGLMKALIAKLVEGGTDRKSTRLNSSHVEISYAVFCLKKKKETFTTQTIILNVRTLHSS